MTAYNLNEIEFAIINDLRHNITDPLSRGSSGLSTQNGDDAETDFTIPASKSLSITVDGTLQKYGVDYTINSAGTTISFVTAPPTGTNNVVISYKYGTTWIYPDFNKQNIQISDFPRISCNVISSSTQPNAIGGANFRTSLLLSITIASKTRQEINSLMNSIRERLLAQAKNYGLFVIIEPSAESAIQNSNLHDKILQRTIDFIIPYKFEVVS